MERFHQTVDRFIAELAVSQVHSIAEMNEKWKVFLEEDYQKKPHEGIAQYYKSKGIDIPQGGITPLQEWNRSTLPLDFPENGGVCSTRIPILAQLLWSCLERYCFPLST